MWMNKKQKKEQDAYLIELLGNKCVLGYHDADFTRGNSALGRVLQTKVVPESSRKAEAL